MDGMRNQKSDTLDVNQDSNEGLFPASPGVRLSPEKAERSTDGDANRFFFFLFS